MQEKNMKKKETIKKEEVRKRQTNTEAGGMFDKSYFDNSF